MGKTYAGLDKRLAEFIRSQHVFFVATAPPGSGGQVHLLSQGLPGHLRRTRAEHLRVTGSDRPD
jgi:hypothetical protein